MSDDLTGRRFGSLAVLGDSGERKAGSVLWRCRCDCGGEALAMRWQLEGGSVADCGCGRARATGADARGHRPMDLAGQRFGELTVIKRAANDPHGKACWECRCSCGNLAVVKASMLRSGRTRSCGCLRHREPHNFRDLTGQRFGRLTVTGRSAKEVTSQKSMWHCRCDCGNEVDVYAGSLLRGLTSSCGCHNREVGARMHEHMHYQDGTCSEILRRICDGTATRTSKAGFRGLFLLPGGKYRASITFQGRHYDLGHFTEYGDAVRARLEAEEALHVGYLRAREEYGRRAAADPGWAEANPFHYSVERIDGRFVIDSVDMDI